LHLRLQRGQNWRRPRVKLLIELVIGGRRWCQRFLPRWRDLRLLRRGEEGEAGVDGEGRLRHGEEREVGSLRGSIEWW